MIASRTIAVLRKHSIRRLIHCLPPALFITLEVLRKVMSDLMYTLRHAFSPNRVLIRLLAHLEELLSLLLMIGVPQAVEVFSGHGIDHAAPYADALFAVLIKDVFLELIEVNAGEAIIERANVCEAACQAHAAADLRSVYGEYKSGELWLTMGCRDVPHRRLVGSCLP
jgi:hypothetical protein